MEDLEQRLQAVLQDPAQMQQIMEMAKAFGLGPGEGEPAPEGPAEALPQMNLEPMARILRQAGRMEKRQVDLLNAIKPFLRPGRREKIDRAMQAARLSQIAGAALRSRGESEP